MSVNPKTIIQTADLPPVPHVLQQVLALADNPRTTGADLEKIVVQEPTLVAQMLKWVNSAFYSLPQRVSSVSHAMILLGFSTVKSIASGLVLIRAFDDLTGLNKDFVGKVWKHTLTSANIGKFLAGAETTAVRDDIFLALMIHDVGYLVLSQYFQVKYDPLIAEADFPSPESELQTVGVDHAMVGSELLVEWKFPERVIDLVRYHHSREGYEGDVRLFPYIEIADDLGMQKDLKKFFAQDEKALDTAWLDKLQKTGWTWPRLCMNYDKIEDAIAQIRQLF